MSPSGTKINPLEDFEGTDGMKKPDCFKNFNAE
jgi:hypothetical protein